MKLLTPEALDHFHAIHGEHSVCFNGDFVRMREIIAQAKLAHTIQQKAANVFVDVGLITDNDGYYRGFDECKRKFRDAILAMEIPT